MPEFSDYASYLEVAFAINLMFSLWDKLPESLVKRLSNYNSRLIARLAAASEDAHKNARYNLDRRRDSYNNWCKRYARYGKVLSFIFAICIGVSLYFFAGYDSIQPQYNPLLSLAPLPPFLTVFAMFLHFLILALVGMINVAATNNLTGKPQKEVNEPPRDAWKQKRQANQPPRPAKKEKEWWEEDGGEEPF